MSTQQLADSFWLKQATSYPGRFSLFDTWAGTKKSLHKCQKMKNVPGYEVAKHNQRNYSQGFLGLDVQLEVHSMGFERCVCLTFKLFKKLQTFIQFFSTQDLEISLFLLESLHFVAPVSTVPLV